MQLLGIKKKHFIHKLLAAHDLYWYFGNKLLELTVLWKLEYFLKYYWIQNKSKNLYNFETSLR